MGTRTYRDNVQALTFDLFGTILDLGGSLVPFIEPFLQDRGADVDAESFWVQWRARQRIEQYQDNIMALGHSGYQEVARRLGILPESDMPGDISGPAAIQ